MYIISHFLNEEFLLPYWLKHHVPMFDHGIMIDYGSSDASVDIIQELAPDWEIRRTKVEKFEEPFIGLEIQDIEQELPTHSWKVALNTTEFLVCPDLRTFIEEFEEEFPALPGFRTTGIVMVDSPEEQGRPLTSEFLLLQRKHGVVEQLGCQNVVTGKWGPSRCRFVHRLPHGGYSYGRHMTNYQYALGAIDRKYTAGQYWWKNSSDGILGFERWIGTHPEIFVSWFGRYCPFESIKKRTAYFDFCIPRKSFIEGRIPSSPDDLSVLEEELMQVRLRAYNLEEKVPLYGSYLEVL